MENNQPAGKKNIIRDKSYAFALRIIALFKQLQKDKREFVLSKQLLRSGVSIGANIEEAIGAQSRKDFISKFSIAYKEARESHYWLRLLRDSQLISKQDASELIFELEEILKIITTIQKTTKEQLPKQ